MNGAPRCGSRTHASYRPACGSPVEYAAGNGARCVTFDRWLAPRCSPARTGSGPHRLSYARGLSAFLPAHSTGLWCTPAGLDRGTCRVPVRRLHQGRLTERMARSMKVRHVPARGKPRSEPLGHRSPRSSRRALRRLRPGRGCSHSRCGLSSLQAAVARADSQARRACLRAVPQR